MPTMFCNDRIAKPTYLMLNATVDGAQCLSIVQDKIPM